MKNLVIELYKKGKTLKQKFFIFCLLLSVVFTTLSGQPFDPFTKITDDNFLELAPVIEGDYIVYLRRNIALENGIYLYHIPTGDTTAVMTCNHTNFASLDMSGDRIVWQQYENGSWDIYTYLISRPDIGAYPLIDYEGSQQSPAIDGDMLVWIDGRGDEYSANLFLYDISKAIVKQITFDEDYQQGGPDIYGNYIVWSDGRSGNGDIYMYNIYKEEVIQITDNEYRQRNPTIYKKRIVWEDQRNGNWDLYLHYIDYFPDFDPVKYNWPVYTGEIGQMNSWDQINARISDNYIVYQDNRSYNWNIYLYTFINPIVGTSQPLVEEIRGQTNPSIWENKIVWEDEREYPGTGLNFNNLWMWEKPPGVDLAINIEDLPDPVTFDAELSYQVYISNFGNQSAYNPELSFTLPSSVEFLSMSGFGTDGYSRVGNELFCLLDSVQAGNTDTVMISVRVAADGILTSSGNIQSVEEDIDASNNSTSCKTKAIWKIPKQLDNGGAASVVVDSHGTAHFCYLSNSYGGQVIYSKLNHGILERQIIDSSYHNSTPAIAVDKDNTLHIVYGHGLSDWDTERKIKYINYKTGVWSDPEIAVDNAGEARSLCIKTDKNDSVHISYMTSLWANGSLWYSKKQGAWNKTLIKTGSYNSSSFDLDTAGYAHFSYYDLSSYGLCYKTNSPDGVFKAEESPGGDWHGGQMESLVTDIAVDHLSKPHISYVASVQDWGNEDYKYSVKNDQTWNNELVEEGEFAGADNTIDTDPGGNPHLCYYNPLTDKLMYKWKAESIWHKRTIDFPEYWNPGSKSMDVCVDHLGYVHILYTMDEEIFYVTNTLPVPEPEISVFPQILEFPDRLVGDTTDAKTVVIANVGEGDLVISDIKLVWKDSVHFSISRSLCTIIPPGDTCSVDVKFNPQILGDKQALLWITSNDPGNPEEGVSLKGTGVQGLLWDYGSQVFGEAELGDSVINEYILKNRGNTNLVVQGIYIENGDVEDFYFTDFPVVPFSIPDGDSIIFSLIFKPTVAGNRSVSMKIYSTGGDLTRILSGTGFIATYDISGEIRLTDNSLVTEGWIWVINLDENSPHPKYYFKALEGLDSFQIKGVPEVDITLRFDPDEDTYPNYMRTYLGNTSFMEDAEIISLSSNVNDIQITLMEEPDPGEGSSNASGNLIEEEGAKRGLKMKQGEYTGNGIALMDVPVFLLNASGEIEYADITDIEGNFNFNTIELGEYFFRADYEAYPMSAQNDTLLVTEEGQEFELIAIISGGEISCGITKLSTHSDIWNDQNLKLYPNPFSDVLNLELNTKDKGELIFKIFDLSGRCVLNGSKVITMRASQKIQIETNMLDEGCYIMNLYIGDEKFNLKLIKQK